MAKAGNYRTSLTAERLREVLDYDSATGVFTRRVSCRGHEVGSSAGDARRDGYSRVCVDGCKYYSHRLAWLYVHGEWPPDEVDHKDTAPENNTISNLRPATRSQNGGNMRRRRDNQSGLKGVSFDKARDKWQARIKTTHLGRFATAEAAHAAYLAAAVKMYGEFANSGKLA